MSQPQAPLNTAAAALMPAVAEQAERTFGLAGAIGLLPGEVDFNYRLTDDSGRSTLLKLSHASEQADVVAFQNAAAHHLAAWNTPIPIAQPLPAVHGGDVVRIMLPEGPTRFLRAFTWCDGTAIAHVPKTRALRRNIGMLTAQLSQALACLDHPVPRRSLKWDMMQAQQLAPLQAELPEALRCLTQPWFDRVLDGVTLHRDALPSHPIHNDLNLHNILVGDDGVTITGCLDFGDMVQGPRVVDLAVACAYQADVGTDALHAIVDVAQAYHHVQPLLPEEMDWLVPLTAMRAAMTLIITHWTASQDPDNSAYLLRNAPSAKRVLEVLSQQPHALDEGWMRRHLEAAP